MTDSTRPTKGMDLTMEVVIPRQKQVVVGGIKSKTTTRAVTKMAAFMKLLNLNVFLLVAATQACEHATLHTPNVGNLEIGIPHSFSSHKSIIHCAILVFVVIYEGCEKTNEAEDQDGDGGHHFLHVTTVSIVGCQWCQRLKQQKSTDRKHIRQFGENICCQFFVDSRYTYCVGISAFLNYYKKQVQ